MNGLDLIKKASIFVRNALRAEFKLQGHSLTGSYEQNITDVIKVTPKGKTAEGYAPQYGDFVDSGVSSDHIPYGDGPTGAKSSRYIQGLKTFFILKGLSEKEALSAAFATAKTHKKEGMHSLGSYKYSRTGQRLRFIKRAMDREGKNLDTLMKKVIDSIFNKEFNKQKSEII